MKICIDPGHGGKYIGAEAGGIKEKNVNYRYAHRIAQILSKLGHGVILTRSSDRDFSENLSKDLQARVDIANDGKLDLFISIHCNAAKSEKVTGLEVWTSKGQTKSDRVAENIVSSIEKFIEPKYIKLRKDKSDGDSDKEKNYYVLRKTKMPAVLIELGFITNPQERDKLMSYIYLEKLSHAIAFGINQWAQQQQPAV